MSPSEVVFSKKVFKLFQMDTLVVGLQPHHMSAPQDVLLWNQDSTSIRDSHKKKISLANIPSETNLFEMSIRAV